MAARRDEGGVLGPGDYTPRRPGDEGGTPRPPRPPGTPRPSPNPPPDELDPDQENAYLMLKNMLEEWGLGTLASEVLRLIQDGYTQSQIPVMLQDTDAYKQRFSGNELRKQQGLAVLSPVEYLATERAYRQVMMNSGLPGGFYDGPEDFAGFIGRDVSAAEVQRRVDEASDSVHRMDAGTRDAIRMWYPEIGDGELMAWVLDQNRGRDQINRVVHGSRLAGAARAMGANITKEQAERFGQMSGDNYIQEAQAFGQLAGMGQRLSGFYSGYGYSAEDAAQEVFNNSADAQERRRRLANREEAEFSGVGGSTSDSLKKSSGSY